MAKHSGISLFNQALGNFIDEEASEKSENEYNPNLYTEDFDDADEAWGDLDHQVDYKNVIPQMPQLPKKQPETKILLASAPKPSIISQKYFGIAPAKSKPEAAVKVQTPKDKHEEITKAKIEELNLNLQKHKKELEKNARLRNSLEEKVRVFSKAKEEMERIEGEVMKEIKQFNEIEGQKLKNELIVYERNQKVLAGVPSKKERDEIEALKAMMKEKKDEAAMKRQRYKLNKDRVTKLIEDAKGKKKELLKRIETLESISNEKQEAESKRIQPKRESQSSSNRAVEMEIDQRNKQEIPPSKANNCFSEYLTEVNELYSKKPAREPVKDDSFQSYLTVNKPPTENTTTKVEPPTVTQMKSSGKTSAPTENTQKSKQVIEPEPYQTPEYAESIPELDSKTFPDGRVMRLFESGHRETLFPNGTRKEEYPNGYVVFFYSNQDIKQMFPDGKTQYFIAEANTIRTTLPSGLEVIKFGNGDIEKHYPDGSKKAKYIDGTVKTISSNGEQCIIYRDNTRETVNLYGERAIFHPGGHKEIWSSEGKKRIYHNGATRVIKK